MEVGGKTLDHSPPFRVHSQSRALLEGHAYSSGNSWQVAGGLGLVAGSLLGLPVLTHRCALLLFALTLAVRCPATARCIEGGNCAAKLSHTVGAMLPMLRLGRRAIGHTAHCPAHARIPPPTHRSKRLRSPHTASAGGAAAAAAAAVAGGAPAADGAPLLGVTAT